MKSKQLLNYNIIQKTLGVKFRKLNLLKLALTHSSYVQGRNKKSNETLEFLGDAVLELLIREYLFKKFPKSNEGALSELKKLHTSEEALHIIGKGLGIGNFLLMDRGEELTGGRNRQSNIAGCLEAVIGAIYLDRGLAMAKKFIQQKILRKKIILTKDYKSLVNQWVMRHQSKIDYRVIKEEGPPHHKIFLMGLFINREKKAEGIGPTKKKAEQDAARNFWGKVSSKT